MRFAEIAILTNITLKARGTAPERLVQITATRVAIRLAINNAHRSPELAAEFLFAENWPKELASQSRHRYSVSRKFTRKYPDIRTHMIE